MIITNDEQLLRMPCQAVLPEEVGSLVETLENELARSNRLGRPGIGLAAPQIGIAKSMAIVRLDKLKLNLVNAKLQQGFDPAIFKEEGCLSFPGRVEDTIRYQEIYITDNLVSPHRFTATGLLAVVVQHELDHLNSTLFMDHVAPKNVPVVKTVKAKPNEKCPCGSNVKYKRCCGR